MEAHVYHASCQELASSTYSAICIWVRHCVEVDFGIGETITANRCSEGQHYQLPFSIISEVSQKVHVIIRQNLDVSHVLFRLSSRAGEV